MVFLHSAKDAKGKGKFVLKKLFHKYREVILYLVFGVLTTLVNWGLYFVLADLWKVDYLLATAISQILAILFAYVTNRIWVFESKASGFLKIFFEMVRFFGCRGVSFLLDLGCMYVGVSLLHIDDTWMKLISNVLVVIANYIFSKLIVFRKDKATEH